jgi:hypothetical protein
MDGGFRLARFQWFEDLPGDSGSSTVRSQGSGRSRQHERFSPPASVTVACAVATGAVIRRPETCDRISILEPNVPRATALSCLPSSERVRPPLRRPGTPDRHACRRGARPTGIHQPF